MIFSCCRQVSSIPDGMDNSTQGFLKNSHKKKKLPPVDALVYFVFSWLIKSDLLYM